MKISSRARRRNTKFLAGLAIAALTVTTMGGPASAHKYGSHQKDGQDAALIMQHRGGVLPSRVSITDKQEDGHCAILVRRSDRSIAATSCDGPAFAYGFVDDFHVCMTGHSGTCRGITRHGVETTLT